MKLFKAVKLNIFDYLIIFIFIVVIICTTLVKSSFFTGKIELEDVYIYIVCENVPYESAKSLKSGTNLYTDVSRLDFGTLKEVKIIEKEKNNILLSITLKVSCKAKKNEDGGYTIEGTVYYTGQEARLFANSSILSGYIYDIKEIN